MAASMGDKNKNESKKKKKQQHEHGYTQDEIIKIVHFLPRSSYEFDGLSFLHLYLRYPKFKQAIDSGKYVFVDGKVVLKSKKCLRMKNGRLTTIDFSDEELSEYCLSLVHIHKPIAYHYRPVLGRRAPGRHGPAYSRKISAARETNIVEAKKVSSLKDITNDNLFVMIGGGQEPPNNFCKALVHFMEVRGITVEQLADETGLSEKTIQRMRNDPDRTPSLESVVAVCVGLHLDAYDSDMLLHLAGYQLTNRKTDRIYRLFLNFAFKESVKDCNNMLIRLGMKPLTDLHE